LKRWRKSYRRYSVKHDLMREEVRVNASEEKGEEETVSTV
jgi:hypothetical protein